MSKKSRRDRRRARMKASRAANHREGSWQHRTLTTIQEYLEAKGLAVMRLPKGLMLDFAFYPPSEVTYRDDQGDAACMLAIDASEDGRVIRIYSPNAWCIRGCPNRASVFEALVRLAPECRSAHFRHDPATDEVGLFVTLATIGREVSGDSIMVGVCDILMAIMNWDSAIRQAITNGEAIPSSHPHGRTMPSRDEQCRIAKGLMDGLAVESEERWRRVREDYADMFDMPEEPLEQFVIANAVIVHKGWLLCLTPTLPADFERHIRNVESKLKAALSTKGISIGL